MTMAYRKIRRTTGKSIQKSAEIFDSINGCRRAEDSSRFAAVIVRKAEERERCGSDLVLIYITER